MIGFILVWRVVAVHQGLARVACPGKPSPAPPEKTERATESRARPPAYSHAYGVCALPVEMNYSPGAWTAQSLSLWRRLWEWSLIAMAWKYRVFSRGLGNMSCLLGRTLRRKVRTFPVV